LEIERVREQALSLGIDSPIEDGALRQIAGECVFLDPDRRCLIHKTWGAEAKPQICRQYPWVVLQTSGGTRVGVDPGCYHGWRSWRDGAEPSPDAVLLSKTRDCSPAEERAEAALVELLGAVQTPSQALAQLVGPGIEGRWATRLRSLNSPETLRRTPGPKAQAAVAPLFFPPVPAPPWPQLDPETAALTLNAVRTFVALRQGDPQIRAIGSTLLMLLGALAAAWQDTSPAVYCEALAGWSRCLRLPAFWHTLIPGPESLQALVGGAQRPRVS
jgi:hypothetical protein